MRWRSVSATRKTSCLDMSVCVRLTTRVCTRFLALLPSVLVLSSLCSLFVFFFVASLVPLLSFFSFPRPPTSFCLLVFLFLVSPVGLLGVPSSEIFRSFSWIDLFVFFPISFESVLLYFYILYLDHNRIYPVGRYFNLVCACPLCITFCCVYFCPPSMECAQFVTTGRLWRPTCENQQHTNKASRTGNRRSQTLKPTSNAIDSIYSSTFTHSRKHGSVLVLYRTRGDRRWNLEPPRRERAF